MQGAVQIRDNDTWKLESVHVTSGNNVRATATVALRNLHDDSIVETATMGSGPVDAIYKSITDATGTANSLEEFSIQAITSSTDSLGRVTVRIESGDNDEDGDGSETRVLQTGATQRRTYVGHGQSMDILMASAEAHLSAINRLLEHRTYFEQMHKRRKAREVLGISAEAFNKLQSESLEK
jgi:2-isopropylmalate synthase